MTLRKGPGGVWRIEFQLAGVRVHRSARTRDRKAAEELEARLRAEVYAGRILGRPRRDPLTVRGAFDRYVEEHLRPRAAENA